MYVNKELSDRQSGLTCVVRRSEPSLVNVLRYDDATRKNQLCVMERRIVYAFREEAKGSTHSRMRVQDYGRASSSQSSTGVRVLSFITQPEFRMNLGHADGCLQSQLDLSLEMTG